MESWYVIGGGGERGVINGNWGKGGGREIGG